MISKNTNPQPYALSSDVANTGTPVAFRKNYLADEFMALANESPQFEIGAGETLIQQGGSGAYVYIVLDGRFRAIHTAKSGKKKILGEIGRGEPIGEMAMATGDPYSATVIAIRQSHVAKIDKAQFAALLSQKPEHLQDMFRLVVQRSKTVYQAPVGLSTLAVAPFNKAVDLPNFLKQLETALSASKKVLIVTETHAQGNTTSEFLDWISLQKKEYDLLIFVLKTASPDWNEQCIRQSDRVLILGNGNTPFQFEELTSSPVHQIESLTLAPLELVLIHPDRNQLPQGTADWLTALNPEQHFHVANGHTPDFERLARHLTGRSIGLVCSGGGAKGAAHLGVYYALNDAGITVDRVGGTSAGALFSIFMALEWDRSTIAQTLENVLIKSSIVDITPPFLSLFAGKKGTKVVKRLFGDINIEDLWVPFYCVSVSLQNTRAVIHTRGKVWKALRASASLPGIWPPMMIGKDYLVDGGLINNAPVDIMRKFRTGQIVLSDVTDAGTFKESRIMPPGITGWGVLADWLNPFRKKRRLPGIIKLMTRANFIAIRKLQEKSMQEFPADLVISLPLKEYGILDFTSYAKVTEVGYAYTQARVEEWKEVLVGGTG